IKIIKDGVPESKELDRVEQAIAKVDAEWEAKLERAKEPDVDSSLFFTDEELDALLSGNDIFSGNIANLSNVQRFEKLKKAARWLDKYSMEIKNLKINDITSDNPNAYLFLDVRKISTYGDKEKKMVAALWTLADLVVVCAAPADNSDSIRMSFGVHNIWSE
ncbi:MAG: hypothetical protein LIO52_04240, partial [Oscillospiraceae bacterium]|nr:hypothetical protein [Oscillospiraceae bacterium]